MKTLLTILLILISTISYSQCDTIISPNAFTPTLSTNYKFYPSYINTYTDYTLSIYNRWGMLIFVGKEWDGTYKGNLCDKDVFVWEVVATKLDCRKVFYGTVTLIR